MSQLNSEQKLAVETIEGPVLVVAGPGTGKTQVLTLRIAHILQETDTNPSSILALTFTDAAAKNIKQRLLSLHGAAALKVPTYTFHGFARHLIDTYPEYVALKSDSEPIADLERFQMFEEFLQQLPLRRLRPLGEPTYYLHSVIQAISELKRENQTPESFAEFLDNQPPISPDLSRVEQTKLQTNHEKMLELQKIFAAYQARMHESGNYDFDDLILVAEQLLVQQPDVLAEVQERYLYTLVDEYQDTNASQNQLVDRIAASHWQDNPNLFVVGDPQQSIYRFQGALFENMAGFLQRYPSTKVIHLKTGYRCPQPVYDAAHSLITHAQASQTAVLDTIEPLRLARQIKPPDTPTPIAVSVFHSRVAEQIGMAQRIRDLVDQGVSAKDIVVLLRTNQEVREVGETLTQFGLPVTLGTDVDVLAHPVVEQLLQLCRLVLAVRTGTFSALLTQVAAYAWTSIDPLICFQASRLAGLAKTSLDAVLQSDNPQALSELWSTAQTQQLSQLQVFYQQLTAWSVADLQLPAPQWFEQLLTESGFVTYYQQAPEGIMVLQLVRELFGQIKRWTTQDHQIKLENVLQRLNTLVEHKVGLALENPLILGETIEVTTVHKAKGREWSHVFVPHLINGSWGNSNVKRKLILPAQLLRYTQSTPEDDNDDNRRLLYVAITRAKAAVNLSWAEERLRGGRTSAELPSMYLTELPATVVSQKIDLTAELLTQQLGQAQKAPDSENRLAFFKQATEDLVWSVSTLTTYLRSPDEFVSKILLRLPQTKTSFQAFGTAIHHSLQALYKPVLQKQPPLSLEKVLHDFDQALDHEVMLSTDVDRWRTKGHDTLTHYYRQIFSTDEPVVMLEKVLGSKGARIYLDQIPLSGRLDRVDWLDQNRKLAKVIDYKTGKAKSANAVSGATLPSYASERERNLPEALRGELQRQAIFYGLLCQLDTDFRPKVASAEFIFVEPTDSGKVVRRVVEILPDHIEALKQLLATVAQEVKELTFLSELTKW